MIPVSTSSQRYWQIGFAALLMLLFSNVTTAQPYRWCKTIDAGPNFKEMYGWEDGDFLGAARYDVRTSDVGIIYVSVATLWMGAQLNDRGLRGDPEASDSIFWHWEKAPLRDGIYLSEIVFSFMTVDSTRLTSVCPPVLFPNIRDVPEEMCPNEGMDIEGDTVEFSWNAVDEVDYYAIYIWDRQPDIENFSAGLCYYNEFLTDVRLMLPSAYLNQAGTYYWIIIVYDETLWEGGGMEIAQFEYRPNGIVIPPPIEISRYVTIYPNPGNTHFRIEYDTGIPNEIFNYRIYNLLGRSIKTGIMMGGHLRIEDLSRFSSGEYILRLQSPHTSFSTKFSLIK